MTRIELWSLHNTTKTANLFCNLYERWQDEKDYEDIAEYLKVIQKSIPEAIKITKRPFSVMCKCDDGILQIGIKRKGEYMQIFAKSVK
ncbi:MAG: hypothetical protein RR806_07495 [Oscillospiraceae bacterium]